MTNDAPYRGNVATLPDSDTSNAVSMDGDKERIDAMQLVVFDAKAARTEWHDPRVTSIVDARWYMARRSDGASPVYCSVWIRTRDGRHFSGHGKAGGYGYHKQSAALQDALDSAGVKLAKPINGCGDGAMCHALTAVGKAAGYGRCPQGIV